MNRRTAFLLIINLVFLCQILPIKTTGQTVQKLSGLCGECTFMNTTDAISESCLDYVSNGQTWDEAASGRRFYMRMYAYQICLGYSYQSQTAGDKNLYVTRLMPGYSPFEKVRIMNLFSTISEMQIHVNLSSGFAAVSYPSITSAAVWYIVYAGNLLQSPWLNITGEPRSSVVLTMKPRLPISGAGEDNWYMSHCYNGDPAGCLPNVWSQYVVDGRAGGEGPDQLHRFGNPVSEKRVWCTRVGRSAREESCGLHLCNANVIDCKDPAPDRRFYCTEARKNMCMNSGLCYCNPHFGGSTCEIEFGQPAWNATTKTFETLQCRPDFAAGKPYDFYHPHCFYHNLRVTDLPNSWRLPAEQLKPPEVDWPRWDFWTCATFNPCSGAGTCVDSGNLYEPPRCVCYDGFFGSRPQEMEAFARTFECAGGTENLQYWSDTDRHDMRRYMMTHQCLLWNGRDGPRNYKLHGYRPAVPITCAERTVVKDVTPQRREIVDVETYRGVNCLPCPECARSNGTCVLANVTSTTVRPTDPFNVCQCDDNHIGVSCQLAKCPTFQGSPCGVHLRRGRCVLKNASQPYEPYTNVLQSPFRCACENGYNGTSCEQRLCAFKGPHINESLVCSGSVLSSFPMTNNLPHGFCNITSHNTSACVCLPGFTGIACQLRECPRVNGTGSICNNVTSSQPKRPVCINDNPNLEPICDCTAGFLGRDARDPLRRGQEYMRYWGSACQFSYNDSCADPNDEASYFRWCQQAPPQEDYKSCAPVMADKPPGVSDLVWRNSKPVCRCPESSDRTGVFCNVSKCGQRNDEYQEPVPADLVCSGYRGPTTSTATIRSGQCRPLSMPMQASDPLTDLILNVGTGSLPQLFGRCECIAQRVPRDKDPRFRDFVTFMGDWCQIKVHGCTNPNDEKDANKGEVILPCSGRLGEPVRGLCREVEGIPIPLVPPNNATDKFRCECKAGFAGSYCQNQVNVCQPPCRPGAGECGPNQHCECFYPTLWTKPNQPVQCGMDWCNTTGGITSLYGGVCFCPPGRAYTKIDWPVQEASRHPPLGYFAGCRFTCPMSNGLECGGYRQSVQPGSGPSFCGNALQVNSIDRFKESNPECKCYDEKGIAKGVIGMDPVFPGDPTTAINQMLYVYNAELNICEPYCAHGSKWDPKDTAPTVPRCTCDVKDRDRYLKCSAYEGPRFTQYKCTDPSHGTWQGSLPCKCHGLWQPPTCAVSNCGPAGRYTPAFGPNICNCTYPYRTELNILAVKTFGSCVSDCGPNGEATLTPKRTCQCKTAWEGDYCDVNRCLPFGQVRQSRKPGEPSLTDQPCYCVTPVYTGPFCKKPACRSGVIVTPTEQAHYCECYKFFDGTICDRDTCGIIGDDGTKTGVAVLTGEAPNDYKCRCTDGYEIDASGRCTKGKCGPRGLVIQDAKEARGFRCKCSGPDFYSTALRICIEGSCGHGTTLFGFNNTRVTCLCDPGYTGVNCTNSICPELNGRMSFKQGGCVCNYPFVDEARNCSSNICGPGVKTIQRVNLPGNPVQWECQCDIARGFVLQPVSPQVAKRLLGAPPVSPYRCVLQCDMNNTATVTPTACICKPGFIGIWCQTDRGHCPACPSQPIIQEDGISQVTFIAVVVVVSAFGLASFIAVLVVYFKFKPAEPTDLQRTGSTAERLSLLSSSSLTSSLPSKRIV